MTRYLPMDPYSIAERKRRAKAEEGSLEAARLEYLDDLRKQAEREARWQVRQCSVPVEPGFGQAAYKAGCEDEWIDRMTSKYGGDW